MSTEQICLKGITWNHSRGFTPMAATGQRFSELNPGVEIVWEKRSLQQFADRSILELAEDYDLLVIDHPWAGFAAKTKAILPLDEYLPDEFISDQRTSSVGRSFDSYVYDDHLWALPIDAATPVASSRPDLLLHHKLEIPATFEELLNLAESGLVAFSLIPIDTLMSFYMFCCTLGEEPALRENEFISTDTGRIALKLFKKLADRVDRICFESNPIRIYELMSSSDRFAYCPFAYGYSNYSRAGYAAHELRYHDLVTLDGRPLQSTLGGTGLAVSRSGKHLETAVRYAQFVASPGCQRTLFADSGGQPGHLAAWTDAELNRRTRGYFTATLPALERAYLRPRYHGHMFFQDHAGEPVRNYLLNGGDEDELLHILNDLYSRSRTITA